MTTRVRRSIAWERLWTQRARNRSPASTACHLSRGEWVRARHLNYLDAILRDALVKGNARIIIEWPPGHGKSHYLSKWTPVWFLNAWPHRNIILASNTATLAEKWGREVRDIIETNPDKLEVRLSQKSMAKADWLTTAGGGMLTKGVGGTIMGFRPHLLVIDDPHEGQAEANSETKREGVWLWYRGQARSRLEPNGSIIVLHQRLHEADLIGLLTSEDDHPWQVITLRAIAEDEEKEGRPPDPLGREPGEALWPERFPLSALADLKRDMGSHSFDAQYQQHAYPTGGSLFNADHFLSFRDRGDHYELAEREGTISRVPKSQTWTAQTCDTAMKIGKDNDWTVVLTFAVSAGRIIILDVQREQLEVPDQWPHLCRERAKWPGLMCQAVEEKGSGIGLIQQAKREGRPLKALKADVDKVARAVPLSIAYEQGLVYHPARAPWLGDFEAELKSFPNGAHDDQVDAAAYAALLVQEIGSHAAEPPEIDDDDEDRERGWRDELANAYP